MGRSSFLSRRQAMLSLGYAGAGAAFARLPFGTVSGAGPLFEEVPASVSGITWVHDNAMSDNRYLPETMGPGVAFLDYDNDGWMDVFLVNSGASDFYTPTTPLKNGL